jgi:hypothetical protein
MKALRLGLIFMWKRYMYCSLTGSWVLSIIIVGFTRLIYVLSTTKAASGGLIRVYHPNLVVYNSISLWRWQLKSVAKRWNSQHMIRLDSENRIYTIRCTSPSSTFDIHYFLLLSASDWLSLRWQILNSAWELPNTEKIPLNIRLLVLFVTISGGWIGYEISVASLSECLYPIIIICYFSREVRLSPLRTAATVWSIVSVPDDW